MRRVFILSFPTRQNLVDAAGVEPAVPEAADLQSTGVTNFPTHPKFHTTDNSHVPPRYWNHSADYTSPDGSRYVITVTNPTFLFLQVLRPSLFTICFGWPATR